MDVPAAIVLDIEGTTTPISFVYEILFPYARAHVAEFLRRHASDAAVRGDIEALAEQSARDVADGVLGAVRFDSDDIEGAIENVRWQMSGDRKTTPLKSLQGKIWQAGYADGELRGVVFEDVPRALKAWHRADRTIAIYSSGSVEAQRLLFTHSVAGDLSVYLAGYYDTTTGPKREPTSYGAIAEDLRLDPGDVLFATDILEEARAAHDAGMQAVIMRRPGNHPLADHDFPVLETFDSLR